ncbi:MAG TPA: hypothetical protein VGN14_07930 [Candidatus Elarobacter sp.]|jgi:hypothetical protein
MLLAALVLAAIPTYGPLPTASPTPPAARLPHSADEALIIRSNSTNTAGYKLYVYANGTTALQQGDIPLRKHVSAAIVSRFFADLRAAGPLDQIRMHPCMKSASFGTTLTIVYRGTFSPDVSCPATAPKLEQDALALADAAGVSLAPRPISQP